jgi:hypothetical protein
MDQRTGMWLLMIVVALIAMPSAVRAQDGECPLCVAEEPGGPMECDRWSFGIDWCASAGGVCVHGEEFCEGDTEQDQLQLVLDLTEEGLLSGHFVLTPGVAPGSVGPSLHWGSDGLVRRCDGVVMGHVLRAAGVVGRVTNHPS